MTRQEFIDDVRSWSDLLYFCGQEDCDECEDIVDSDYYNEYINDSLVDWARNDDWTDLRDRLNEYYDNSGYDYYLWDDYYGQYNGIDNDDAMFEDYKRRVLNWMDEGEYWPEQDDDEEDEEEEYTPSWASASEPDPEPEDEEPIPDEDCSFVDMFAAGVGCVASINEEALRSAQEADRVFAEFTQFRRG